MNFFLDLTIGSWRGEFPFFAPNAMKRRSDQNVSTWNNPRLNYCFSPTLVHKTLLSGGLAIAR